MVGLARFSGFLKTTTNQLKRSTIVATLAGPNFWRKWNQVSLPVTELSASCNNIGQEQDAEFGRKLWWWPLAAAITKALAAS